MYLRSVRLKGFKSFARKTELQLEQGVAVVIGPNGSGKSNLAEAVMWALGAQSPAAMRGASMQDVIFAGSDGRRAAGGAEVELTFDNGDAALAVPAQEISVMRRVSRDGQSDYFINHAPCRLTDVVELMSGVGLGKELHSIIGQGRVESFLASRPAERRALVEEAAGLGRYKRRRERALLKLRETQRNLERAIDLEREVGAQLAPLRRQASAAEQLRAAARERDEVLGRLLAGELAALGGRLAGLAGELDEASGSRAALEAELAAMADRRAAEEEGFARALRERERRAERALRARALGARLESCLRLTEQRRRLSDEMVRSAEAERDRLLAEISAQGEGAPEEWADEEKRLRAAVAETEAAHAAAAAAVAAARRRLTERRSEAGRLAAEREAALLRCARLEERGAALLDDIETLEHDAAATAREADALRSAEARLAETAERVAAAQAAAVAELDEAVEAEQEAARDAAAADAGRAAAMAALASVEAETAQLAAALAEAQEIDPGTVEVVARFPGTNGLTAGVGCDEGYELALGAALAPHSGGLVVPAGVDAWVVLDELQRAGVRSARLLLAEPHGQDVAADEGFGEPLAIHVHGGSRRVRELVERALVVDDLRVVPEGFRGVAVTRGGAFFEAARGQLGLAAGMPAAVLLQRRAHLDALERRRVALQAESGTSLAICTAARADAERAAQRRLECERRVAAVSVQLEAARREAAGAAARLREVASAGERMARRHEGLRAELTDAQAELGAMEARAAELLVSEETLAGPVAQAEAQALALEEEHEITLAGFTRARVELEQRAAAAARRRREREEAARRMRQTRERLVVLERRLAAAPAVGRASSELLAACGALRERAAALDERLQAPADQRGEPDTGVMRRLAEREAELRRAADEIAERRTAVQVEAARLEARRADVAADFEQIATRLELAHFAAPADDEEAGRLREALERCARRVERIGPVNPLAEAECDELGERAAFLREQRRDLERSLQELEALIAELTSRIDAGFAETFAVVREHFGGMIGELFPGGRGGLSLVPGEDGEDAGIAMDVKPGRKLGKRLSMLSGGERALAAIAFLMALMLARPSPFYILDEIEAALDDVNIGRFVALLRAYRDRTQFIIITHQKRTMEAADILYGVTMGPDAASHVVSARMAEQEIDKESEARRRG